MIGKYQFKAGIVLLAFSALQACSSDKDDQGNVVTNTFTNGVIVGNEGAFGTGYGELSFYSLADGSVSNDLFVEKNGHTMGSVLNSLYYSGDAIYAVINYGANIEEIDPTNMNSIAVISGFSSPRYIIKTDATTAYVTDWVDDNVKIVNTKTRTVTGSIKTGAGPERMVMTPDFHVYVANSGGYAKDSTITVIDAANHVVVDTFYVGSNPASMALDVNGKLWVLCSGYSDWNDPTNNISGSLHRINLTNGQEELRLDFAGDAHPARLTINGAGDKLYYLSAGYGGQIMEMNISASTLPTTPLITKSFYSFDIDAARDELYGSDPLDYVSNGLIYRYSSSGNLIDSASVGVIPSSFIFR